MTFLNMTCWSISAEEGITVGYYVAAKQISLQLGPMNSFKFGVNRNIYLRYLIIKLESIVYIIISHLNPLSLLHKFTSAS